MRRRQNTYCGVSWTIDLDMFNTRNLRYRGTCKDCFSFANFNESIFKVSIAELSFCRWFHLLSVSCAKTFLVIFGVHYTETFFIVYCFGQNPRAASFQWILGSKPMDPIMECVQQSPPNNCWIAHMAKFPCNSLTINGLLCVLACLLSQTLSDTIDNCLIFFSHLLYDVL